MKKRRVTVKRKRRNKKRTLKKIKKRKVFFSLNRVCVSLRNEMRKQRITSPRMLSLSSREVLTRKIVSDICGSYRHIYSYIFEGSVKTKTGPLLEELINKTRAMLAKNGDNVSRSHTIDVLLSQLDVLEKREKEIQVQFDALGLKNKQGVDKVLLTGVHVSNGALTILQGNNQLLKYNLGKLKPEP